MASRHLTTTLVLDMASSAPVNAPVVTVESHIHADTAPPTAMAIAICIDPPGEKEGMCGQGSASVI